MDHDKRLATTTGATSGKQQGLDNGVGKRTLTQDLSVQSAAPVQRKMNTETMVEVPGAGTDNFSSAGLRESDIALLGEAAEMVSTAVGEHKGKDKEVLVFIGVGTGNPSAAWGNPTHGGTSSIKDADQQAPGFLTEAQQSYFVISVNFNVGGDAITSNKTDTLLDIHVPARFPLEPPGHDNAKAALESLKKSAQAADRFAIMNAVTATNYGPILDLAKAKRNGNSSYLKSYMQTGETSALSPINPKKGFENKGTKFDKMNDVFAADAMGD